MYNVFSRFMFILHVECLAKWLDSFSSKDKDKAILRKIGEGNM
jgi:hypothetical protein